MIFVTSDQHFGHKNIIAYCGRRYSDVAAMDTDLIEKWNSVVRPRDTVYHLGDFTLGDYGFAQSVWSRLHGRVRFVCNPWHHDGAWLRKAMVIGMCSAGGPIAFEPPMVVIGASGVWVTMTHFPMLEWQASYHGGVNLHGHCHGNLGNRVGALDVSVDCHDGYPIRLDGAIRLAAKSIHGMGGV